MILEIRFHNHFYEFIALVWMSAYIYMTFLDLIFINVNRTTKCFFNKYVIFNWKVCTFFCFGMVSVFKHFFLSHNNVV